MQHPNLSPAHWQSQTLERQMANIGSEVIRALRWRDKHNALYANQANYRALELFDLTLQTSSHPPALREVARARELWLDYFVGNNQYHQTAKDWEKYFLAFNFAAQNKP